MSCVGGCYVAAATVVVVPVTGVAAAHQRSAYFPVLGASGRNVRVFACAGLMQSGRAVRPTRVLAAGG